MLTTTNVILLLLSAVLGSFFVGNHTFTTDVTIAGAVVLSACVILTAVIEMLHLQRVWHDGRAVAESVKTLAWRYMTRCDPYSSGLDDAQADRSFLSDLSALMRSPTTLAPRLSATIATMPQITSRMRNVRSLDLPDRKSIYLTARIDDQVDWYTRKAERNRKSSGRLSAAMIVSLVLAIASAVFIVRWPDSPANPVGFLVSLALAFLAWLETGRHEELAQSYGIAAQELSLIRECLAFVTTDKELSDFVSDAENSVSRGHTLWLARADRR